MIDLACQLLNNSRKTVLMLSHGALTEAALDLADQVAQATGARLICDTFTPKLARGEGRCEVERLGMKYV